jgi:hypothetical protein
MERALMVAQHEATRQAREAIEERAAVSNSGAGSGGYILIDMPEKDRPFFHDLLKGFEDYSKLKGYTLAFSIDSSYDGRIGFKFTVKNDGIIVGPERVRQDFKEYVENIRTGEADDLDHIPVIVNMEEHNYLVTQLKLRINFLQHSHRAAQTTMKHYENLLTSMRTFPVLPVQNIILQTGGSMETRHQLDSRSYSATHSQNVNQGDNNTLTDNSINIGKSFNEKKERLDTLDDVIGKLAAEQNRTADIEKIERELTKVRDELTEYEHPNEPAIRKWLEYTKNAMTGAILGHELVEAAHRLWALFGV